MARSQSVSGTFTGTGQSDTCYGNKIVIKMDFAGTASVDLEASLAGAWIKIETGITADYFKVFEAPVMQELRLNCTSFTNNVVYEMQASVGGSSIYGG